MDMHVSHGNTGQVDQQDDFGLAVGGEDHDAVFAGAGVVAGPAQPGGGQVVIGGEQFDRVLPDLAFQGDGVPRATMEP